MSFLYELITQGKNPDAPLKINKSRNFKIFLTSQEVAKTVFQNNACNNHHYIAGSRYFFSLPAANARNSMYANFKRLIHFDFMPFHDKSCSSTKLENIWGEAGSTVPAINSG